MLKVKILVVFFVLVCWPPYANFQAARPSEVWFFNSDAVMDFWFAQDTTLIVVCHVRSSTVVQGVEVYSQSSLRRSGVKVFNLRVEEVIKGSGIVPGTEIQAVILPWVMLRSIPPGGWDPQKDFEELRKTGKLPTSAPRQDENYPDIADGQVGIFRLFPASFEDPTGSMMWLGADKLNQGKPLFGCSAFFPMDVNHQEVKVLQRYLEIGAIENRQEQMRELAHFSLKLLKNPQAPPVIALGAAADAIAAFPDNRSLPPTSPVFEKQRLQQSRDHLDDQGLNELVQIAADPSRSLFVRYKLMWAIHQLVELGRSIDFQPLFRMLENGQDDLDIRSQAVRTLGDLDNPEVRKKFEEMLSKPTADHADKYVQDEIRNSKIMKQPQNK